MATKKVVRGRITPELASRLLRTVPQDKAFYFFTDIGQYSGKVAVSLADFCKSIDIIDVESVDFHFKRQDFEKWIRGTIGDASLANMLNRIKRSAQGEELRAEIRRVVKRRLTELEQQLAPERGFPREDLEMITQVDVTKPLLRSEHAQSSID